MKTLPEVQYDRARFAALSATEADGSASDPACTITITPSKPTYAVVPINVFAQARRTTAFPALASLVDIWDAMPTRRLRLSRLNRDTDAEIIGVNYSLPQIIPKDQLLQLNGLEVAAVDAEAIAGAKLRLTLDGITADEWQALFLTYKIVRANDEIEVVLNGAGLRLND